MADESRITELREMLNGMMDEVRAMSSLEYIPGFYQGKIVNYVSKVLVYEAEVMGKLYTASNNLNGGNYGNCSECHGEISVDHLSNSPFTHLCSKCEQICGICDEVGEEGSLGFQGQVLH